MRCVSCLCGVQLDAEDAASLNDVYWSHTDEKHGDFKISEVRRRNATEALLRTGGWGGQRLPIEGEIQMVPLRPGLKDDYLRFFDGDAFADNPAWASCYCFSYTADMPPEEFEERTAAENRADRAAQIESGEASGVLAYAGGKVVGWCHAAPRRALPQLDRTPGFEAADAASGLRATPTTGAIVCYVIAPAFRGQGLAKRLLDAACDMLRDRGLSRVEAYPPAKAVTDAGSYHGRVSMYLDAGFERVRDAGRHVVVAKAL